MRVSSLLVVVVLLASVSAGAAESAYRVAYANGVTVEVVAVSVMPSRNKPFWSPDGQRLVEAPFETRLPGYVRDGARVQGYEVVTRVDGVKEQPIYLNQRALNGITIGYGATPFKGSEVMKDLRVFDCSVPPGMQELEFELGIAANDWKTVQTFTKPGVYGEGPRRVEVTDLPARGPASPEGNPWFNVKFSAAEGEVGRLMAIDDAGASHVSTGRSSQSRDGHFLQGQFAGLARDRVREFWLQKCSYQWQAVKGIRLKPAGGELDSVIARYRNERLLAQEARFKAGDAGRVHDAIDRAVRTRVFENVDEWAGAVRELAEIGAPAVPAIVNEIRRTARPYGRSALAIALRAIEDPRAVPGLAEALADAPFGGSDYGGARAKDLALSYFMVSLWRERDSVGVGTFPMRRPVNEITYTLEHLTGHTVGNQHQRRNERALFHQAAGRWRAWWETNGAALTAGLPAVRVGQVPAARGPRPTPPMIPDARRLAEELKADPKLGSRAVLGRWTLLHLAIVEGRLAEVDALITGGADVNAAGEDGWTPLHLAAALGHGNAVENLLDHKADVRAKTAEGSTPLHAATRECSPPFYAPLPAPDPAVVGMLLDEGADVKAADARGRTPLHGVAAGGDGALSKVLLERGALVDAKDARGRTPLHRAVECDNEPTADVLLLQGADVNAKDASGRTPIRYASYSLYFPQNAPPLVRRLLEHGAEVELATTVVYGSVEDLAKAIKRNPAAVKEMPAGTDDQPPIQWAIRGKSPERLKLLLDAGADVNALHQGNSPLHTAVFAGDTEAIKMLIAAKADVNAKGNATPLYWACHRLAVEAVELLLAAGANPRDDKERNWGSYLSMTLQAARENDRAAQAAPGDKVGRAKKILEALFARGAEVNERTHSGFTPIFHNGGELAEFLLARGAKLDVANDDGDTPLHYAAVLGLTEPAQFLLKHKVPLEARNKKGETPLHKAVGTFEPRGGVLEMLLEHKADLSARDADGRTPLHRAVMIGSIKGTTALLEKGADVKAKDNEGATPLHHAAKNGRDALVPLLIKHGADVNATDSKGQTPIQWATTPKTRDVLTEHGAKK